ncbi:hypothetical protein BLNAU_4915 [Blattamonas nauphoetae]|uniref:Uncharacterized protein n=1 Tax=Blattamonas nauphoetae TaxID=2049346 RepID=A0ABQ9Y8E3_9EUKA|nr:hypothetical protein BLNAU_4915 [Blattamonas nauphoetae]
MGNQPSRSKTPSGASLNHSRKSHSTVNPEHKSFLNYEPNSELSYTDKSAIYCSLVALVKVEHPFDNALQDRAARFLIDLEQDWRFEPDLPDRLVTELVPSSAGSPSGFVESIVTLLSSPRSRIVVAAISFLHKTTMNSTHATRCRLMKSDLVSKVLATVQPQTLPISGNEPIFDNLIKIIERIIGLASPDSLSELGITSATDAFNHREMIFPKVLLPSSQFVTFLISNQYILSGDLINSFMYLLETLLRISPFHRQTLEFVIASPIVMAFSTRLSSIRDDWCLRNILVNINESLEIWTTESPEVSQSGQRMRQALFSEGFEDTLEQKMIHEKSRSYGIRYVANCHTISQLLGSNVKKLR